MGRHLHQKSWKNAKNEVFAKTWLVESPQLCVNRAGFALL